MVRFSVAAALFAAAALAAPSPLTPDPAGAKNVGNGKGAQFIGGACLNSRDCASACCATLNGGGICSGVGAQNQNGKQGCGFGDGRGGFPAPPPPAASEGTGQAEGGGAGAGAGAGVGAGAPSMEAAPGNGSAGAGGGGTAGDPNVGKGNGSQFITGPCLSDADCASGCCNGPKGACAARAVAQENGKAGCGFRGA